MKTSIKAQILVLISIILILLMPNMVLAKKMVDLENERYVILQDDHQIITKIVPVDFYLLGNGELSPQLPKEGKPDSFATCPNGFVPARWAIFGRFGSVQWKDVGTWYTIPIKKALKASGLVNFQFWVSYSGSGSPTGTFDFYWRRGEENIAEVKNYAIGFQETMAPTLVDVKAPLINQTPFQVGDVFSLYIRCRNNFDGAQILFGSREHSSSVIMNCDPLSLIDIHAKDKNVKGIYDDIFSVRPMDMSFQAKVDNVIVRTNPEIGSEVYMGIHYRTVSWKVNIDRGSHDVEISLSYGGLDNSTMISLLKHVTIKGPVEPTFLGFPMWFWYMIIFLIVLFAVIGGVVKYKNYREEQQWLRERGNYQP